MAKDAAVARDVALTARIDRVIDAALGKRIVGAVILLAKDGRLAYRRAAGFSDREAGRPMREDAIFRFASLSKPVTATAALALIDQGRLALDDTTSKWLPDFRPRLADGSEPDITIRHLLTHTSGLSYRFAQWPGGSYHRADISDGLDQPGLSMEGNLRRIASVPLSFEPGTAWGYSVGTDVLGAILACVHGGTLGDVVAELVTGPLGLVDTGFAVRDLARLATPYADGTPEPVLMLDPHEVPRPTEPPVRYSPSRALNPDSFQSGGAGLVGTAPDFLAFLEALRTGGSRILKPETFAAAARNQIGDLPADAGGAGWRFGFLSGVLEEPVAAKSPQSAGTMQWGGAYGNIWFIDPASGLSFLGLTNTAVEGVDGAFPTQIRDAIYART